MLNRVSTFAKIEAGSSNCSRNRCSSRRSSVSGQSVFAFGAAQRPGVVADLDQTACRPQGADGQRACPWAAWKASSRRQPWKAVSASTAARKARVLAEFWLCCRRIDIRERTRRGKRSPPSGRAGCKSPVSSARAGVSEKQPAGPRVSENYAGHQQNPVFRMNFRQRAMEHHRHTVPFGLANPALQDNGEGSRRATVACLSRSSASARREWQGVKDFMGAAQYSTFTTFPLISRPA